MDNIVPKIISFNVEYSRFLDGEKNIGVTFDDDKLLSLDYVYMTKLTENKVGASMI